MSFFLTLILFLFLYILINIAMMVWRVRKHISYFRKTMEEGMNGNGGQRASRHSSRGRTAHRTADGVTIIDDRSPSDVNKKIFAPDEGEYVDYKEV